MQCESSGEAEMIVCAGLRTLNIVQENSAVFAVLNTPLPSLCCGVLCRWPLSSSGEPCCVGAWCCVLPVSALSGVAHAEG